MSDTRTREIPVGEAGQVTKNLWDSIVRTFTPIIVGSVLGFFIAKGIALDDTFEPALTALIQGVASGAYYLAARLLETYVTPRLGWLLGKPVTPAYIGQHAAE